MTTTIVEDPAIVAGKEAEAAHAAWRAAPHDTREDEETPEFKAAETLLLKMEHDFADAPVASLAGARVKMRALLKDLVEDDAAHYATAHVETVLAFLEGFAAAAPDPVVTLFAEWGAIQDEANALSVANPEAKTGKLNDRWEAALDRRDVVGDKIMSTPATSIKGVAVKVRLASHYAFDIVELAQLHHAPSRDIDYDGEGGAGGALNDYLVSALRDAERLAGET